MKIAYILPTILDEYPTEGAHSQQFNLISGLLLRRHYVTVFSAINSSLVRSNNLKDWQPLDLKLTKRWIFNKLAGATWKTQKALGVPYLNIFRNMRKLEAYIRFFPDYDLCFERVGLYSVAPALASRWHGMPYILFFDADVIFELDYAGTPLTGVQRKVVSWMQRKSLQQAKGIICVSDVSRNHLESNWHVDAQKMHVLPNAVDIQQFRPLSSQESAQARNKLLLPDVP